MWQQMLGQIGDVSTIVVPVADEPGAAADPLAVTLPLEHVWHEWQPERCQWASEYTGARWSTELGDVDVVVALRSYMGPFAVGFARGCGAPLIVDLDDDDAAFLASRGDHDEARRAERLVGWLRPRTDALTSVTGFGSTSPIPNTYPSARPGRTSRPDRSDVVVCVGNFTYAPNHEGARWLAEQVMPFVSARRPATELRLVGPGSDRLPGGIGPVDDLDDVYRHAGVAAVPIHTGSGSRVKVLEAWHHGVPVVSTRLGVDGLVDPERAAAALIADGPYDFATAILDVLDDGALSGRLVAEGVERSRAFDPAVVGASVAALVDLVTSGRPAHAPPRPVAHVHATEVDDGIVVDDEATGTVHHLDPMASMIYVLAADSPTIASISDELSNLLDVHPPPDELVLDTLDRLERLSLLAVQTTAAPAP